MSGARLFPMLRSPLKKSSSPPLMRKKRTFLRFCMVSIFGLIILIILGAGTAYLGYKLVTPHYINWANEYDLELINELESPSIIYDRKGQEIGRIFAENRSYVPLDKISPHMINALIAQEDSRFRTHNGFDPIGIARAGLEFFKSKSVNQGASSITQQLARNAFDLKKRALERNENGFGRKIAEIFLSLRIEKRYSKDQILEFYLNRIYLGSGYYGVRSASLGYFGKEPNELTLREAASIAALIKNPKAISPLNNPNNNLIWRNHVLNRLTQEGYLSGEENERLKKMPLGLNPKPLKRGVSHVYEQIANKIGEYLGEGKITTGGLQIHTTLDKDIQDTALAQLNKKLEEIERRPDYKHPLCRNFKPDGTTVPQYVDGAVLTIENETGAILAYIGGRDYSKRQFDAIEQGARPPGTAFLPIVYAAALEHNYTPATLILDDALDNRLAGIGGSEGILGEWGGESLKNRYEGDITARRGLSASKISATVRLGQTMGTTALIDTMKKLHLSLPTPESTTKEGLDVYRNRIFVGTEQLSLKELTRAYASFPSEGELPNELYFLEKINDETGYTIWQAPQSRISQSRQKALSPASAFQIYSIMGDSLKSGSAEKLKPLFKPEFYGTVKTGTNYDFADNWGFATNARITCGVWIGFTEGKKPIYPNAFSIDTAGPILAATANATIKDYPAKPLSPPSSVDFLEICRVSGKIASKYCYDVDPQSSKKSPQYRRCTYTEIFKKGDRSILPCDIHAEDGLSLEMFVNAINPNGSTKILPVPPIIPKDPVLLGQDPYQSEKQAIKVSTNYDLDVLNTVEPTSGAEIVEDEENAYNDALLELPTPPPIKLINPEITGA